MTETSLATGFGGGDGLTRRVTVSTAATILVAAAVLHLGREVFLPLAIATLLAFALSPMVSALRRRGWGRVTAVLSAVTVAFVILGGLLAVMAGQLAVVAQSLPTFQSNIIDKLESLQATQGSSGVMGRFLDMLTQINDQIGTAMPTVAGAEARAADAAPMQVAVVESQSPWRILQDIVLPVISPVVTGGLVVVVVIVLL